MDALGYIVCKNKVTNVLPCIEVVSSFRSIEDKTKPILIIGLEEAKKNASSFSILNKKLSENIFWTFGKREKRNDYERDVEEFQNYVLKKIISNFKYYYFNVLTVKCEKVKNLLKIIKNNDEKKFFVDKSMVYMFYKDYILGLSTEICEYIGVSRKKILKLLRKYAKNNIFYNDLSVDYKIKQLISDKRYMIAYFVGLND